MVVPENRPELGRTRKHSTERRRCFAGSDAGSWFSASRGAHQNTNSDWLHIDLSMRYVAFHSRCARICEAPLQIWLLTNATQVCIPPLGIMMLFRAALLLLLTVALNAAAISHCRVGGMTMDVTGGGGVQSKTHDHEPDCGKPEKRICDAMVQMTAPDQPSVAPILVQGSLGSPVFATLTMTPTLSSSSWQWHPPPIGGHNIFKEMYARNGRLLV